MHHETRGTSRELGWIGPEEADAGAAGFGDDFVEAALDASKADAAVTAGKHP